jgi:hypothetical protein
MNTAKTIFRAWAVLLTAAAGLFRLLPSWLRPYNLAPVGATGLFGGARLSAWQAYSVPLFIMVFSDCLLWAMLGPDYGLLHYSRAFVYGSLLLYVVLGRCLVRTRSPLWIGGAAVAGSVQFFLVTNFGEWLFSPENYAKSLAGLVACYAAAIPFFHATLLSDLGFSAVLFGVHAWLTRSIAAPDSPALCQEA